jgi:hypothetical protein
MQDPVKIDSQELPREQVFNDDLLMNEKDLAFAYEQFPSIAHVLDFPQLRDTFKRYERAANRARRTLRLLGFASVLFATVALLSLSTRPLWPGRDSVGDKIAFVLELGGALATVVAAGGMASGKSQRVWLECRLMTERLRQWHFQFIVRRAHLIAASCEGGTLSKERFQTDRIKLFNSFLASYEGKLPAKLTEIARDPTGSDDWLHQQPADYPAGAVFHEICRAYKFLRFDHQCGYADYKLRDVHGEPIWRFLNWPAKCQLKLLSGVASACLAGALLASAVMIADHTIEVVTGRHDAVEINNWDERVRIFAVAIAIVGAALHTLRDGLAPYREIERYNDYAARTAHLRNRFILASDGRERGQCMEQMEMESVYEMRSFIRTHQEATFLLA